MKLSCNDRERIFLDGSAEEWAALEQHATSCQACAEEIRAWKSLSVAAEELRSYPEDAGLWGKIETSLREQQPRIVRRGFWDRLGLGGEISLAWRTALAGALVIVLALSGVYVVRHGNRTRAGQSRFVEEFRVSRSGANGARLHEGHRSIGGGDETAIGIASDAIADQLQGKAAGAG